MKPLYMASSFQQVSIATEAIAKDPNRFGESGWT